MRDLFSDGLKSLENVEFLKCSTCNKTTPILISEKCITCHDEETKQSEREKVMDLIEKFRKDQSKELKIHNMWVAGAEYLKELRQGEQR